MRGPVRHLPAPDICQCAVQLLLQLRSSGSGDRHVARLHLMHAVSATTGGVDTGKWFVRDAAADLEHVFNAGKFELRFVSRGNGSGKLQ